MPNIKSAKKRVLISKRNTMRNKEYMSSLRTAIKKALDVDSSGHAENVNEALRMLDKSVSKGIFHRNAAARKKSMIVSKCKAAQ